MILSPKKCCLIVKGHYLFFNHYCLSAQMNCLQKTSATTMGIVCNLSTRSPNANINSCVLQLMYLVQQNDTFSLRDYAISA